MNVEKSVAPLVQKAISEVFDQVIDINQLQFQKTLKDFEGEVTLVVFPLVKLSKKSPEQTGQLLGEWLVKNTVEIERYNVVKGFLNLSLTVDFWRKVLNTLLAIDDYGRAQSPTGKTYVVEYASPNTNKPLHLGHLRNIFLGYSVSKILEAVGHKVVKTQVINDRGIHICKSMIAWQLFGNGETPETNGLKGDHLIGKYYVLYDKTYKSQVAELLQKGFSQEEAEQQAPILLGARELLLKWEAKDEETYALWKRMNEWVYAGFDVTYRTMEVDFDSLYYESDTYLLGKDVVQDALSKGVFYQKEDGSVWCPLQDEKMDDKLVLRGDGTSVYITQDIGTAIERFKHHPDMSGMIYTVGNEQNHHFAVLFAILKKLGYSWANGCYHLSYGMVELPQGKMKSREGTVVDADDLMQSVIEDARQMTQERGQIDGMTDDEKEELFKIIGLGGLKYYLLKVDPKKMMKFDPQESIDLNGHTAPFIQYAYARIQSILRNVQHVPKEVQTVSGLHPLEIELVQLTATFPDVLKESASNYSPALVANYCYDLVKVYNSFYQSVSILREEDNDKRNFRIALSYQVGEVVRNAMNVLGVKVPTRM
jgi:arginyl-tRNA synthetase